MIQRHQSIDGGEEALVRIIDIKIERLDIRLGAGKGVQEAGNDPVGGRALIGIVRVH
ncbi:hypothetical protein D3C77_422640 [compost metagenome]